MKKTVSLCLAALILALSLAGCGGAPKLRKFTDTSFDCFDTVTTVIGYAETKESFDAVCGEVKAMLLEYHRLFTVYDRFDGLNNLAAVNGLENGSHKELTVDPEIVGLLSFAKELYAVSGGRVNVAMGSVLSLWHEYRRAGTDSPETAQLPPREALEAAAAHTDIAGLILDPERNTVFLSDPEMTLDVGAVAKGYAAERIARRLEEQGVKGYLLNIGGNVRTIGKVDGSPWNVGVENPDPDDGEDPFIEFLHLDGESLVTSGVYQRFYTVDGKEYHHIIDPETLMPGENYRSVTVLADDSGLGDGLSTALFLMDWEEGLALVDSLDRVEAMWVTPDGEQRYSKHFREYTYVPET